MNDIKINFRGSKDWHSLAETISIESWEQLAFHLRHETKLLFCTASELKQRWEEGRAVCVMDGSEIVSYISFATNYDASFRALVGQNSSIDTAYLPEIDVYESTTGWTHAQYRGQGLQSRIHKLLYDTIQHNETGIGYCAGLGASPIFIKLGWHLIDWVQFPYVASLGAWFEEQGLYVVRARSFKDLHTKPYSGSNINRETAHLHDWENFVHLWVQDIDKVNVIEEQLRTSIGDIDLWRDLVVDFHSNSHSSTAIAA